MPTLFVIVFAQHVLFVASAMARRPNFLFIMSDSHDGRLVDPSSVVSSMQHLPNIQRLARNGVNFVTSYCNSPQCTPSRSSMFTGRRTDQIKVFRNAVGLAGVPATGGSDPNCLVNYNATECARLAATQNVTATLNDTLSDAGYNVTLQGKMHIGAGFAHPRGFDAPEALKGVLTRVATILRPVMGVTENGQVVNVSDPLAPYRYVGMHDWDPETLETCVDLLERLPSEAEGQFLYCSFFSPHPPFDTNATFLDLINTTEVRGKAPPQPDVSALHPFDYYMSATKAHIFDTSTWLNASQIAHVRSVYYAMGAEVDTWIGRLLDALDSR